MARLSAKVMDILNTGIGAMYLRDMVKELKGTKVWDDFKCFFFCGHNNITQMIKAMEKVDVIKVSKNGDYIVTPRKRTTLRAKFDSCIRVLLESNGNSLAIPEVERKIKRMYGISFRHISNLIFGSVEALFQCCKSAILVGKQVKLVAADVQEFVDSNGIVHLPYSSPDDLLLMQQTVFDGVDNEFAVALFAENARPKQSGKQKQAITRRKKAAEAAQREQLKMQQTWKQLRAKTPCKYFKLGRCVRGKHCEFSHDVSRTICRHFVNGYCFKGALCPLSHDTKDFPCYYFHEEKRCSNGDSCRFSHDAINDEESKRKLQESIDYFHHRAVRPNI